MRALGISLLIAIACPAVATGSTDDTASPSPAVDATERPVVPSPGGDATRPAPTPGSAQGPARPASRTSLDAGSIPEEAPRRERRDPGLGLSLEGLLSVLFEDDPQGGPFVRQTGWGLRAGWDLSRMVGLEDTRWALQPELQWTSRSDSEGTRAVVVERRLDSFFLGARLGRRFGPEVSGLRIVPYVVAGPSATSSRVDYQVADPVGRKNGVPASRHEASGLLWGAGYGAGIGASWVGSGGAGLTGRAELVRFHRSYLEDLALTFGLGVTF